MLQLQCVTKSFEAGAGDTRAAVRVLDSVSLTVSSGQIVVVRGARGGGKSTLLRCAAGLLSPDQGERRCLSAGHGVHLWSMPHDWRRASLRGRLDPPALHLFDAPGLSEFPGARSEFAAVLRRLELAGHAVVIASGLPTRDLAPLLPRRTRWYALERGRLLADPGTPAPRPPLMASLHASAFAAESV